MAATKFVFVHHDGRVETDPAGGHAPMWVVRQEGGVRRAFERSAYGVAKTGAEDQEAPGVLVWVERPLALYDRERQERIRRRDWAQEQVDEMPYEGGGKR